MEYFSPTPKKTGWSKMFFCLLFFLIVFTNTKTNAQYCTPAYTNLCWDGVTQNEYFSNVNIASINYGSACGTTTDNYSDFTAQFSDVYIGVAYQDLLTLGTPFSSDSVYAWVDWNQDGVFDVTEAYSHQSSSGGANHTAVITVPATATLGLTRIRFAIAWTVAPTACGPNNYGEAEDYSLNVQPAPACTFASLLNVTNISATAADLNWVSNGSASYYLVRYKMVSDPSTVPTWANPTTVTAPTTTLAVSGLTPNSQYEFQVNAFCSSSDSSGYSISAFWTTWNANLCFDCPPTSIPENESCGDDVNGGCNMPVPFFESIACGDTICGTSWADGIRDTDWFTFNVATPGVYTIVAKAAFPAVIGYIGPNATCPLTAFTDVTTSNNVCDSVSLTGYLTAGDWIYFIAPNAFSGYPCGSGYNNYITYVCAPNPPATVSNDICDSATLITQNTTCVPTTGDVAGAFIQSGAACFGTADDDVWYKFVATTNSVTVQITGSSGFYPVGELYDACGGNQLACIAGTGTGGVAAQTIAPLNIGQTYYVRVYDANVGVPATTTFDICIFDGPPPLPNDFCSTAIPVLCGDVVTGTTIGAISDIAITCGTTVTAPGVWYSLVGDGSNVFVSTCTNTTWDTKINVYTGDCNNLVCVGGNDDFCALQSRVSFIAQLGVNYYILVNGYNNNTGDFTLDIVCTPPCILTCSPTYTPESEACGDDVNGGCNMTLPFFEPILCGDTICGSAWAAVTPNFPFGGRDTDWFTFDVPAGGVYTINARCQFPAQMGYIGPFPGPVTSGDCPISNFTDFVTSPNECDSLSLTGYLATGTWIYFISPSLFDGFPCGSSKNTYITYVCAPNPPMVVANDICDSATLLIQNTTCNPTSGDVAGAFIQGGPGCTGGSGDDDVWYKFVATSTIAVVQVTGSASFDAVVEVYDACGGNQIACIDATFGGGIESQYVGGLNIGQTYYIRVYDWFNGAPATTTFDICVFDVPPPCFVCSPSYTPEAEACGDDTNGGCNMALPFFEPIACGDTICGSAWAEVNVNFPFGGRDTDWFTFDVPAGGVYTINAGCQFPAQMGYIGPFAGPVTSADCPIFNFTDYVTTPNTCQTLSLTGYLAAGTWIYFISPSVFTGYSCGGGQNTYVTYVCAPTPPMIVANDICDSAILLTQNATCTPTTGDVLGAFIQAGPGCTGGSGDDDVWYKFVATSNSAIVEVTGSSNFDPVVEVYDACGGNQIACIDATFTGGTESQIVSGLTSGQTYVIRVYDWFNGVPATTTFDICVYDAPPPPPGDVPCDAIALSIGTNGPYDNSFATFDVGEPAPTGFDCVTSWCNSDLNNTLWFTFVTPTSGRIEIQSPGYDTQLAIWDATDCNAILNGGATLIVANDDDPNYIANNGVLFSSFVSSDCLIPGHTYYLQLDGYFNPGITTIIVTDPGTLDASFATLNIRYCPAVAPVTLVPVTPGGVFSGPGIVGNTFSPAIAGLGGPYEIVYSLFGCINDTLSTVVEYPVADITPAGPITVCYGHAIPLTTPFVAGYKYTWKRNQVPVSTGSNTYTPTASGLWNFSVKVKDSLGGGCYTFDTVSYHMINFPNPTLIVGPCVSNTILLTSSVSDPSLSYQWVKWNTPINGATNSSYTVTTNGGYRIAITDSCGTLRFTPLTVFNVTSCRVEEISDEQAAQMVDVSLYPNPNEGQFTIDLNAYDLSSSDVSIDVYNVLGQIVYSKIFTLNEGKLTNSIQLPSTVEDGLYNVRIKKGNYETYTKIVVSK